MRFIDLPIAKDPYAKDALKFTWRGQQGLVKVHRYWAQAPDRRMFYFEGQEIVTPEGNPRFCR